MSRVPTGIPILSFSSLESFRENYYYPLTSPWIWNKFNRVLEQEGDKNAAVSPIPPFPGIFAYSREEGKASKAGPAGERTSNGIESKEKGKEAMGAPEPWQNYKLALFELQWEPSKKGKWWDGCSWREVWDLTLGNLNVEPV